MINSIPHRLETIEFKTMVFFARSIVEIRPFGAAPLLFKFAMVVDSSNNFYSAVTNPFSIFCLRTSLMIILDPVTLTLCLFEVFKICYHTLLLIQYVYWLKPDRAKKTSLYFFLATSAPMPKYVKWCSRCCSTCNVVIALKSLMGK